MKLKVLLVEDDPGSVLIIEEILKPMTMPEFDVYSAGSLAEAIEVAEEVDPDVVLMDLTLPDSMGISGLKKLQEVAPVLPIVVLTGNENKEDALEAVRQGAQDYLIKGKVESLLLSQTLRYAIERKRNQRALEEAHHNLECRIEERTTELTESNKQLQREVAERSAVEERLKSTNELLEQTLRELKETQHRVMQQERLNALGSMARGIAHDFNNALAPILGFSEMLLLNPGNIDDKRKVKRYLSMISTSAKQAADVVGRLREFCRERDDTDLTQKVDLNKLASQGVLLTKPKWRDEALGRGVTIHIIEDLRELPVLIGRVADLQEAINSLLINAAEAMSDDGLITIRTRDNDDKVILEIEDTGRGMPVEIQRRCLDPFFTTKKRESSGFGLPTSYGIIRRHNGELEIESEEGVGTTLRLKLPKPQKKETKAASSPEPVQQGLKLLVVDDEPLMREVLTACLKDEGHDVVVATDGVEGLKRFETESFDMVITDRAMPNMNGDQLAREIKQRDGEMFIILLTGFGQLMEAAGEHPEDVDLVVSKPFTLEKLRQSIGTGLAANRAA